MVTRFRGAIELLIDDEGNPPCDPPDGCDVCSLFVERVPGESRAAFLARIKALVGPQLDLTEASMSAGPMKRLIPPGHVDALCLHCRPNGGATVVIPRGTTACPDCGQEVHPLSLPSVHNEHRTEAVVARMVAETAPPVVTLVRPPTPKEPAPKPTEPEQLVTLPENMLDWLADTRARRDQMAREEAEIVEELKRVRNARKLMDAVLARIAEPAETELSPTPITIEVKTIPVKPTPAPPLPIAAPTTNGHVAHDGTAKPWAKLYTACVNCGTTERKHAVKGRCTACHSYWLSHDDERPESLWKTGGTP